jgi:hypothetical protein
MSRMSAIGNPVKAVNVPAERRHLILFSGSHYDEVVSPYHAP